MHIVSICNRPAITGFAAFALLVALLAACDRSPTSGHGFTLPEGDAVAGQKAFVALQCTDCHSIAARPDLREGVTPTMTLALGGETTKIQTYGDLVTSIINPSHAISKKYLDSGLTQNGASAMRNYNDIMTVSQLVDIVTFLQEETDYVLHTPMPTHYPYYGIP